MAATAAKLERLEQDFVYLASFARGVIRDYPAWAHDELHSEALVVITEAAIDFDGDTRDRFRWFVTIRIRHRIASFYRKLTGWNRRTLRRQEPHLSLNVPVDEHGNGNDKPSEMIDLLPAKDGDPVAYVLALEQLEQLARLPAHLRDAIVYERQDDRHQVSTFRVDQRRADARKRLRGAAPRPEPSLLPMKPRIALWHISNGRSREETAEEMGVGTETVKEHLKRARVALGMNGATLPQMVAVAIRKGLIP